MIHSTAIISKKAHVGSDVSIGPYSIVHDHVTIGNGTTIGSYVELGIPTRLANNNALIIGSNCNIRSHSVFYAGSMIGNELQTGHYVTVRENSLIDEHVQLGSRSDVQGDCSIGKYTKCHADVHIGKKSSVGAYVWLFPEVLLTNDPTPPSEDLEGVIIEDFAVVASKVLLMPGVTVGSDALVGASSVVKDNIPAGKVAVGNPATVVCETSVLRYHNNPRIKAYPWRRRFHRGYNEQDIQQWISEFS